MIAANDARGELFGAGWLLRHLNAHGDPLPHPAPFFSAPDKPVRGYQIGYRMKNNTYDAWTLPQFEQQMWDLAVFGMNTVQVIAPISDDDRTSPLFHAPPLDVVVGLSALSQKYGLRYDLYYPEMAKDYTDPKQVDAELKQFEGLVRRLPLVDSLHVPGGDPGHTAPEVLFPLLAKESTILHRYHPQATIWVSAQGFTAERFQHFYDLVAQRPSWLNGVFFGPQSREGLPEERAKIPADLPVEFYPDIAHTMHAQFPVPEWDPIFALTEGREPICPRPEAFTTTYRRYAADNSGFMLYSEGVNDDVNKIVWAALGWNRNTSPSTTLQEYARYFLGAGERSQAYADAIAGLEQNWSTQILATASTIQNTHQQFANLPEPRIADWRWHSLLYRDAYDRYLQIKRDRELSSEQAALRALAAPGTAQQRMQAATQALQHTHPGSEETEIHSHLEALAGKLFHEVGLQLSIPRYGASNWERGANLDRIDTPLNDRTWLTSEMHSVSALPDEAAKQARLQRIAHWQTPAPGGYYDDLGDPANEPHLVRGVPWTQDPEMYRTAINGIADRTLENGWRLSWLSYAETLYETPLSLRYTGLNPDAAYTVRITYAGENYALPMEVLANGTVVRPLNLRKANPQEVEFALPPSITKSGTLTLQWQRQPGAGGSGRGGQVAEVWLSPGMVEPPQQR
ncbi:hypothetical protein GCM10022270_26840 [Terriglobus aquaticus]